MAPNPIMLQRKQAVQTQSARQHPSPEPPGLTTAMIASAALVFLVATTAWARDWLLSGAAVQSLLMLYGEGAGNRVFPDIPLWTVLATLNLFYAIASTSWLLWGIFVFTCYNCIFLTSLFQFAHVADLARRGLRKILGELHFTRDRIAFFNLPALEIDVDVSGLMVLRGVTLHLSTLTIVVHGVELGLKLTDDIELSLYADEVKISLFRRIEVGEVHGNVKGGTEMTLTDLDDVADDDASEEIFLDNTPLLRSATAGSRGFQDRPKLRESLTGVSYMKDSTAQSGLGSVTTMSPDDEKAEKRYYEILSDIRTGSTVYQSRQQVQKRARVEGGLALDNEKDMRAAICAELQKYPSIAHPPEKSVRVSTLKQLGPPSLRRFLHRLPFLLRLLLAALSYFHAIGFASISVAGSGKWLSTLLQEKVFKQYTESSLELRKLERRISKWLANANFCLQLTEIDALAVVPLSTAVDIIAYLKFYDIMAYRTDPDAGAIAQVVRLGGADATLAIPSYLLPHHEHLVPPKASEQEKEDLESAIDHADGEPKTKQAEAELKTVEKDETNITISVHASLPASFDQSLLNFIAALVKATKMIELEKDSDDVEQVSVDTDLASPTSSTFENETSDAELARSSTMPANMGHGRKDSAFKNFTKNVQHNLKQTTAHMNTNMKEFVKELHQSTKEGVKKAVVGGMVNDRWIAKLVGKAAASLQKMQGDLGYSGKIPVPLAGYRAEPGLASKLLP